MVPATPASTFAAVADQQISLSPEGPPETVLPAEPQETTDALRDALAGLPAGRRDSVAAVVARWPGSLAAWASLGELARDDVEAYACFRVGYHRGLDRLRQSGWRGSGYVRWAHETNRAFLRSLVGLQAMAGALGETDEERRCGEFLLQLEPGWQRIDPGSLAP
jgi:hypothetical protein